MTDRLDRFWAAIEGAGHAACGGWFHDDDPERLVCACGAVIGGEAAA